ncbi:uncharacterized protein BDZ99DRAFT_521623 [Mytilinidion resinicola]|uniref:Amino acid permease/ SLC12A domain-containing protein n=1 Tax=Mytilinidion resinicola TaxID=574789 RepID=A0A6A6YKW8_9PEZI|nr:uncharacterized protein BDZ99DRAFT_521623 [Mytilinidion resinicola]KAF2809178.1 hypothetical protein BDZ99DRAFT_521623 [Mytilinidion resinicola]
MSVEKGSDIATDSKHILEDGASVRIEEQTATTAVFGEAVDLYGNVATAKELGYVQRGLKSRHLQLMALGGAIGTALFLGIGGALAQSGPLSVILGYSITGAAVYAMMMCLVEMTTWLPLPGAIPQYCSRYVDPATGFAVGWNNWYPSALAICTEISATAVLVQFWNDEINPAAWISIIIVVAVSLNIFAVSIYGEAEFIFAAIKIVTIVGLLITAFIEDLGGSPAGDRFGFRYWYNPGPAMKEVVASGNTGRFLGLLSTLMYAAFSYGGVEMMAVAAGEAVDPRKNVPKTVKRIFWRIVIFYVFRALAISVLVPFNDPELGSVPPWVIAVQPTHGMTGPVPPVEPSESLDNEIDPMFRRSNWRLGVNEVNVTDELDGPIFTNDVASEAELDILWKMMLLSFRLATKLIRHEGLQEF